MKSSHLLRTNLWIRLAFIHLLLASLLGLILRFAFVSGLPDWMDFANIRHAHSHVAMLGWLYSALFIFIVLLFEITHRWLVFVFWATQLCVFGMLVSFPIQGYALFSIFFSSAHILLSYVFAFLVWKTCRTRKKDKKNYSYYFLYASLFFLVLSSLGTGAIPILTALGHKGTAVYFAAIQFYLHFQFNGWFIFAALAIFFRYFEKRQIFIAVEHRKYFFVTLMISCFLTFALAVTWSTPLKLIFWANSMGVLIQLLALYFFMKILFKIQSQITQSVKKYSLFLFRFACACFVLKIIMQTLVVFPLLAKVSYTIRNFVIGFIHLLMLGMITVFIFALLSEMRNWQKNRHIKATNSFLFGFLMTEILIFFQGLMLWLEWGFMPFYHELVFVFSAVMVFGIAWYLLCFQEAKYASLV